ncbi:MAG: AmmeMemoRadiSam system radical SAM enzyme [Phycisphaerae bacterium]
MSAKESKLKQAVLWEKDAGKKVRCKLCNHRCVINDGRFGVCAVRKNIDGILYSLNYDKICAANIDPIEKKPLFHFQPGSSSFSISCIGCNFRCSFCQNWQISQAAVEGGPIEGSSITPEQIVAGAVRSRCKNIAYTYTEPTVFMELCAETGVVAKEKGLANVFVSNGYMTKEAINFCRSWLDGINIDLKSFSDDYYRNLCKGRLQPVLDTIEYIAKETNIWMEITTLLVPGENDSNEELKSIAEFIVHHAGEDVPWHISRFIPQYKYLNSHPTPVERIEKAEQIGKQAGLRYIYPGNIPGARAESTFCYKCGKILIERRGYHIGKNNIENSCCPFCAAKIAGFQL